MTWKLWLHQIYIWSPTGQTQLHTNMADNGNLHIQQMESCISGHMTTYYNTWLTMWKQWNNLRTKHYIHVHMK